MSSRASLQWYIFTRVPVHHHCCHLGVMLVEVKVHILLIFQASNNRCVEVGLAGHIGIPFFLPVLCLSFSVFLQLLLLEVRTILTFFGYCISFLLPQVRFIVVSISNCLSFFLLYFRISATPLSSPDSVSLPLPLPEFRI